MNFDIGAIFGTIGGVFESVLGGIFGIAKLPTDTGNGLLNFWRFFEAGFVFLVNLVQKLSGGLAK